MTLAPGTQIEKYRIAHLLGDGGMGAVYAADHVVLGRRAAIKVLHPHIATNAEIVQRFINEALGAASLDHRNIIRVLDCGQIPGNGAWYIALEFLDGESLGAYLHRAGGPIDLPTALHILVEASNGLHAAHERNYVHRDVKPDNFFLTRTPDDPIRVVVLDFGIAKLNQPTQGVSTRSNIVMGTPAYMAPEQLRDSKDVDRRADIFALGVIAYEMATGVRPWGATTSLYDIIAQHTQMTAPPDPRQLRPDIPHAWASVVGRALEPQPERRWPTAKEFAWALAEATPMPYSRNGTSLLEKFAPELMKASNDSLTVGRPVPAELRSPSSSPLVALDSAPPRPHTPVTVSDGVPRMGGTGGVAPPTQPLPPSSLPGVPHGPISTLAASSGQSLAPEAEPRARRWFLPAIALVGLGVGGAAALLVAKGGDDKPRTAAQVPSVADAAPAAEPVKATTTVRIETEPTGADVRVDGVARGAAPIDAQLAIGAAVTVRAELPGYGPVEERVRVEAGLAPRRLTLTPLPDAGSIATSAAPDAGVGDAPSGERKKGKGKEREGGKPKGNGEGTGAGTASTGNGSGQPGFNPDDVL